MVLTRSGSLVAYPVRISSLRSPTLLHSGALACRSRTLGEHMSVGRWVR